MLSCKDASTLISASMDVNLPLRQRIALRIHLIMCKYCSRYRKQLRLIRELCRCYEDNWPESSPDTQLAPAIRSRIKEALNAYLR